MASASGDEYDDLLPGYKLCGYLLAALSVSPPQTLDPLSPLSLVTGSPKLIGFRPESEPETLLIPISNPNNEILKNSSKKKRRVVLVNGGISIVHQLHALVMNACLKIKARVLRVVFKGEGEEEEARAAVLVDVYLPVKAWEGWQFPRQGVLAGSLFKHVSCDWGTRSSLFALDKNTDAHHHIDDRRIWSCSDCHVLGCVMHGITSSASNSSFDLYEIFKSLPIVEKEEMSGFTRLKPEDASQSPGIWDLADDLLTKVLIILGPRDLISVAATCHHFRALAASVMPCMKLKLFPHQEAAVDWMWKREHNAEVLSHPLYMSLSTEDGFPLYINAVSGEISSGTAPIVNDFCGGMFCDEPGLGKTVTALSLILKTHGTLAEPPHGVVLVWCINDADRRCAYYEVSADNLNTSNSISTWKRFMGQNVRRGEGSSPEVSSVEVSKSYSERRVSSMTTNPVDHAASSVVNSAISSCKSAPVMPATHVRRCIQNLSRTKRNLLDAYGKAEGCRGKRKAVGSSISRTDGLLALQTNGMLTTSIKNNKRCRKDHASSSDASDTWVQCEGCSKWRKLLETSILDSSMAWFCSMNTDPLHQSCDAPEEPSNYVGKITFYPGYHTKGTPQGQDHNVQFFTNVLKEHSTLLSSRTMKALTWLANLSPNKLLEMETVGLRCPLYLDAQFRSDKNGPGYYMIFHELGLSRKGDRGTRKWFYPPILNRSNMSFDLTALKIALSKPLDLFRLYLSGATLIVVPANLIDHWINQIQKHVRPGQLRVYVWNGNKKPCAHNLAWEYDIVITTFSRLSAEWGLRKRSVLMQVHWLRVMLDEGHTLGSSLNLTNKLQMAISLVSTNRWILTGTPTPYTPTSQVGHLQPMLKFLHEEAYGQNQQSWEAGILRPFEAQMDEGRFRLMDLLRRIMISARKTDLRNIPPCIKKAVYLHFNEEHARSYNELVVTVRRNILMADWNDPSHVESLLNPKQWKFRSNTIRNVRLSCCVAGHIKVTDAGQDIQETMDILVQYGLDPLSEEYVFIKSSLLHGCSCFRCKDWCRLPVITPCRHFLCLDCVALDSEKCTYPGCGNPYEMQSPEILRRPENPNPKWPVPKDLIELQPSYEQDNWDPDWQSTSSSKVAYLVEKLQDLQESSLKIGYYEESIHRREIILYHQKGYNYTVSSLQESETSPKDQPCKILPEKVIIFSQFLEHIHVIEQQLTIAGIKYSGMYSPMHSSNKMKSLLIFQHDPTCMVLLMDGSAALGLDLSFVTHVFLMEPIWDRSMEEQVISRAHRMGATRPIYVETLAMRGTIEEQMLEFLQDADMNRRALSQEIDKTNIGGARAHRTLHDFAENNYLSQLTFVRTNVKSRQVDWIVQVWPGSEQTDSAQPVDNLIGSIRSTKQNRWLVTEPAHTTPTTTNSLGCNASGPSSSGLGSLSSPLQW